MASTPALDTTIAVVTPENIAFDYQLAGPFRRLPAYLVDLLARWLMIAGVMLVLLMTGALIGSSVLNPLLVASGFIAYFLFANFYGTLLETYFNGRTIGKWACGIRAVDIDGGPLTGKRAFLRNLIRIADLAPYAALSQIEAGVPPVFFIPTGMVGLASMILTRRMQRLGDLAAGTMVIVDERSWRLPVTRVEDPRVPALASFIPADYRVSRGMARALAVYAERRHYLTPGRRREIARHLSMPLTDRFDFRRDIDGDLLMLALYYQTFLRDPRDEPADLGPLAGFSPLRRDVEKTAIQQNVANAPVVESEQVTSVGESTGATP